ncbi:response regulator transcription factor [Mucilaginibacter sp. 21P]|uniref:LytR/AlgR family response regulator transcription factor n=1 Tax=Mucilaginibacter sp. 21P TaxID=2778902 RepID=UPI001C59C8A7|nr:LytTR family DNA-binding domain-containing protein [Mucilaginibacter sp. 21P]QXV64970.1 response regulator transcription factor [Mucilaginibacter sp. 21P]
MINCLVVDDEPLARHLLEGYISQLQGFNCLAACQSAVEAFGLLHQYKVDVLFLDIQMPGITGINFIKSLRDSPKVIFTTAYSEYAVDAFELEAIDYLLKPITFERFLKAIQKIRTTNDVATDRLVSTLQPDNPAHIFLKIDRRLVKIDLADIIYIEAYGDYLKVHTTTQTYVTYMTFARMEKLLPASGFIRIHRSTMVNTTCISFIEGNFLRVGERDLAIGQSYKERLIASLNQKEM